MNEIIIISLYSPNQQISSYPAGNVILHRLPLLLIRSGADDVIQLIRFGGF